ncbi:putative fatty acyl-CoA reductase CG8306 [Ceratina calcarata]|uniref:Fatty acyl-CoA reductase n=2 Tax=Ceratina calcarata TaxID=156304 RepID=A0AAJ7JBN9_9HYME|nr:putative fatty acyl-CoA reductase CG8306 [Ceratina calcarata]
MASNVVNFYNGKTVFITGGTGFVGTTLIEKLLRTVPDIKKIYLLLRPKKGKEIQDRLVELQKNPVFDRLKEENKTDLFKKLSPVAGDVGEENLGLSGADRLTLVEEVNIVIHSAASLDFEANLKTATNINLLGTRRVVQLCQEIRELKALVHVSSAYVNSVLNDVEEYVYAAPYDVNELLKIVEKLDDSTLEAETPNILKDHANSYTFTKHLAEHEVKNGRIPAAIVRPSMITGAWKEPVPGWTMSKNGPQGFLMGASRGVVRRLPVAKNIVYDYIPVDIVVNSLITAAYAVDRDGGKELQVYHCTSSTHNPFRWSSIEGKINSYLRKYPLRSAVWYPHLKLVSSIFLFRISAFFVHFIPAYILDTITKLTGGRPILVRLHTNVNNSLDRLAKFIFTEWMFNNPRTLALHNSLSEEDKKLFNLDIKSLVWEDYFNNLTQGVRTYLSKESPKTLAKARSKQNILYIAHVTMQAGILLLAWWLVKVISASTWLKTGMVVPILTYMFLSSL